jgi:retron-type reverse transcriptase
MDTRDPVSTKMGQIATNARNLPQVSFTSLAHHVDLEWLHEAYKSLDKNKAPGTDGQTAEDFATNLNGNLEQLLEDFKSGRYKAPPLRRVYIPKNKNEKRPIDMTTFTDKILQKAVTWILEPIYEVDFYDCSYGFRPYRSQHKAIKALWGQLMNMGGAWIIDLDIRKYFNSIKWEHLCEILKLRVRDGVIIRTIGKWIGCISEQ